MPRCEICGKNEETLTEQKVSQAELMVCSSCGDSDQNSGGSSDESSSDSKYSTSTTQTSTENTSSSNSFDQVEELKWNYGEVISKARNRQGLTILDLADRINEKESHLREVESGNRQPDQELQGKLESELSIDLMQD